MYKIIGENKDIIRIVNSDGSITNFGEGSPGYEDFIQDVAEQGIEIVEGPDIIEPDYATLRSQEYPSYADQFDQIYHEGVDAWKAGIQEIKDKYPKTITGGTTIGEVPDWVQEAADNWTFNKHLREYVAAIEILEDENTTEEEKTLAQSVIDSTPQEVIESLN